MRIDGKGHDPAAPTMDAGPKRGLPTLLLVEPEDGACHNGHTGIGRGSSIAPDGASGLGCSATASGIADWLVHRLSTIFMVKRMDTHGGAGG